MYCLTDQQIDYILNDIRRNGVEMEDLQLNLLDHICCIVEQNLEADGNFEDFYASAIKTFYKKELKEIEEETILLLTFKKYYAMKKVMIVSGAFSAVALIFGILLKFLYQPGAAVMLVLGTVALSFVFMPLMFTLKMREKQNAKDKLLVGLSALCAITISLAVMFKIQFWPGANILAVISLCTLFFLFLPIYFVTGIRNPETKVNTIVSSVLLVGGCMLFLMLVRTPKSSKIEEEKLTNSFMRDEQILKNEQQLSANNTATFNTATAIQGKKINELCEALKADVLKYATGYTTATDLANKNIHLDGGELRNDFWYMQSVQNELQQLQQAVNEYNNVNGKNGMPQIPVASTIADKHGHVVRIVDVLNNINQIQMFVLQNERMAIAAR